jgi:hypothetical protein
MDDSVQRSEFRRVVEDDRCNSCAVDLAAAVQDFSTEKFDDRAISFARRRKYLMSKIVGVDHVTTEPPEFMGDESFAAC